jgi:hypothetical protein
MVIHGYTYVTVNSPRTDMKYFKALMLITVSAVAMSANAKSGEAKLFNCMDKSTFAVNSECMSKQIASNLVFKRAEEAVITKASEVSDRAIATMTFNPKTMSIDVVAHRDAYLAKN